MKKKVLILERQIDYRGVYEIQAEENDIEILFAQSVEKACRLLNTNQDAAAICVGSRIEGNLDFVREVRATHPKLPLVAVSIIKDLRDELKGGGCDHEVSSKLSLISTVAKIICDRQP